MVVNNQSELKQFLAEEVSTHKGIAVPVRSSLLRRLTTHQLPLRKLHPKPDDEFCFPEIGPSEAIISKYMREFSRFREDVMGATIAKNHVLDPIQVLKIRPKGYMILNGHHRWAAALLSGHQSIRVNIINVTRVNDLQKALKHVHNTRRVALDLDEVIIAAPGEPAEKNLRFPWNRLYPQSVRLGIPSLFYYLSERHYDIWVYSRQLVSDDQIRRLFRHHHAHVPFVLTGIGQQGLYPKSSLPGIEKMIFEKYPVTFHIDQKSVLRISGGEFEDYPLPGNEVWSAEVEDVFRKLEQHGSKTISGKNAGLL